jgi:hypothetical protein
LESFIKLYWKFLTIFGHFINIFGNRLQFYFIGKYNWKILVAIENNLEICFHFHLIGKYDWKILEAIEWNWWLNFCFCFFFFLLYCIVKYNKWNWDKVLSQILEFRTWNFRKNATIFIVLENIIEKYLEQLNYIYYLNFYFSPSLLYWKIQ